MGGNSDPPKFNQIIEDLHFTKIRQKLAPHKISPLLTRKFSFLEKLRLAQSIRLIPDGYHMKKDHTWVHLRRCIHPDGIRCQGYV